MSATGRRFAILLLVLGAGFVTTAHAGAGGSPPPAPTGLTATDGNSSVYLTWNSSSGATSYSVYDSTVSGGPYTLVASGVSNTNYNVINLTNETTYYFVVKAVNSYGSSGYSSQVSAMPQIPPTMLSATAGPGMVAVQWEPYAGLPVNSFNLKRGTAHGGPYTTIQGGLTGLNAIDPTLSNGTTYYYVLSVVTSGGETPNSNEVSATPQSSPSNTAAQLFTGVGQVLDGPGYAVINSALYPTPVITTGSYVDSNQVTHYWENDLSYFIASGTTASDSGDSGAEASYTDPIGGAGTLGWYPNASGTGTGAFSQLPWYMDPVEHLEVYMNFRGLEVDSSTQTNTMSTTTTGGGAVVAAIWYCRGAEWHLVSGSPVLDGPPFSSYGYAPNCPIDLNLVEVIETGSAIDSRKVYGQPMLTGEVPADPNAPLRNPNFLNWTWNGGLFVGNSPWSSGDQSGTARVQFWPQTTPPTFYDPLVSGLSLLYNGYPPKFPAPGGLILAYPASNDPNLGVQPGQATWANAWNLSTATISASLVPPGSAGQYISMSLAGFSPYMILALQNESTIVQNGTGVWCYFGDPSWAAATGLFSPADATPRQWVLDLWPAAPPIPPQP